MCWINTMMSDTESEHNLPLWSIANTPESLADENSPPQLGQSMYNMGDNEQLQNAVEKFKETGEIIHIVKQELRCHLLYKRSREGKEEIDTEENIPKDYQLREEEITKIKRRREQNRMAAQRCRQRKKNKMVDLEESIRNLLNQLSNSKEENCRLRNQNADLVMQVQQYKRLTHEMTSNYHVSPYHQPDSYMTSISSSMPGYAPGYIAEPANMIF